ncbi:MAG: hypothetical protein JOZ15_21280, partial [Acidobacteria bacterium]|nr:hypothetical protein [Acidobacteriota bacterium]
MNRHSIPVAALALAALSWAVAGRSAGPLSAPPVQQPAPPAASAVAVAAVGAGAAAASEPSYAALRGMRPDGRVAAVQGLALDRDAFHFEFESGAFHFLTPVGGRTVGAVFLGHGTLRLNPATAAERRQLALELGEGKEFEVFTDSFEELVLLFADDTAQEIGLAAPIVRRAPDARAGQAYQRWFDRQRRDFHLNLQLRLLGDLLNTPGLTSGVFLALLEGRRLPPALVAVDPAGAEAVVRVGRLGREPSLLWVEDPHRGGAWYLSDLRGVVERGRRPPPKPLARALHYWVSTTVPRDVDLAGVTTIRLQVLVPGLRVLPIQLLPRLRIAEAVYGQAPPAAAEAEPASDPAAGKAEAPAPEPAPASTLAAAVIQEDAKEDGGDAAVIFPEPLAKGSEVLLRIAYRGDAVLEDAGDKNYVVKARESWYPNLGVLVEPAPFDLEYRVPAGNQVVSVGRLVSERLLGPQSVSLWKTDGAIRVAGFNYGKFKKLARRDADTGVDLEVYTNPGTPDIIRTINATMEDAGSREMEVDGIDGGTAPQATLGHVNTSRLAEAAMADGVNASHIFTAYFGPLAEKHVAITQQ